MNLGKCQYEGCNKKAVYAMYRTVKGKKSWVHVCKEHEKVIGKENLSNVKP